MEEQRMGYLSGSFFSKTLEMDTQLGVILPQDSRKHHGYETIKDRIIPSEVPKTIIMLHGLGDNYLAWATRTSILRYAEEYDVAVLMPEVTRSFYQDMKYGRDYFRYITEELPELASSLFHISVEPEDLMIAGLSMGGYGALRCGLTYPERYCGVGVFSSAHDIERLYMRKGFEGTSFAQAEIEKDKVSMWGNEEHIPENSNIYHLLESYEKKQRKPKFYLGCGTEDFLYEDYKDLLKIFDAHKIPYESTEMPGIHEWAVWDRLIQRALDYFVRGTIPEKKLKDFY